MTIRIAIAIALIAEQREYSATVGLKSRRMQVNVEVRNGHSMALCGLQKESTVAVVTLLPVLGEIPVVGSRLFSRKKLVHETIGLMFVITPKILPAQPSDVETKPARVDSPVQPVRHTQISK